MIVWSRRFNGPHVYHAFEHDGAIAKCGIRWCVGQYWARSIGRNLPKPLCVRCAEILNVQESREPGVKERITSLIRRGAEQISRKYRYVAVPPELPPGKSYLDLLREKDPIRWGRLEERAMEYLIRYDESTHIELTREEFNEWLRQHNRQPLSGEEDDV